MVKLPGLKLRRDQIALTQEDLAWRTGIARETISRIENGAGCRHTTVRKLALALDCTPADLQTTKNPAE